MWSDLSYICIAVGTIGMAINSFLFIHRITRLERRVAELKLQLESIQQQL